MARPRKHDLYVVKEPFWTELDGDPVFLPRGERVRSGHELVKQHPDYFEPVDEAVRYDVEQATAAPGELR